MRSDDEPLDVLINASFEYGEGPSNTAQVAELVRARARDLIRRLADIQVGQLDNAKFEEWARDALEFLFHEDLKNVVLKPASDTAARRDIVASNEATHGPWRRIADTHGAHQVVFEVKNFEQLPADAYQQLVSYMGTEYGSAGFIIYRAKGPNPDSNERAHLATHKIQNRTVILLPESLLQRLLKKQSARDILDKFRAWYDNHLRKWCLSKSSPHST